MMDVRFLLIYLIKESIRKRIARDDYFGAAFIALPLLAACVVWFVESLKWGRLVEQGSALDLHTRLNHTRQLAAAPPPAQIRLRAEAPPDWEPHGQLQHAVPRMSPNFQPAVDTVRGFEKTASKRISGPGLLRGHWTKPQKRERGGGSTGDLLVGRLLFVVAWINNHNWEYNDSLQSPEEHGCFSFDVGEQLFEGTCCVCVSACVLWDCSPVSMSLKLQNSTFFTYF